MTETHKPGLFAALVAVQAEAPTLPKDATNPHFNSKFTPLDTVVERMTPILTKHGLAWTTKPSFDEAGKPTLKYKLAHAPSGETEEGEMLLLGKLDPQGQGSGITYARRYALCSVLNLVADADDDGNNARAQAGPPFGDPVSPALTPNVQRALGFLLAAPEQATEEDIHALWEKLAQDAGGYFPKVVGRALLHVAAALKARDATAAGDAA